MKPRYSTSDWGIGCVFSKGTDCCPDRGIKEASKSAAKASIAYHPETAVEVSHMAPSAYPVDSPPYNILYVAGGEAEQRLECVHWRA
jgi:hypothetical protein